jgi:hypothetical protein
MEGGLWGGGGSGGDGGADGGLHRSSALMKILVLSEENVICMLFPVFQSETSYDVCATIVHSAFSMHAAIASV